MRTQCSLTSHYCTVLLVVHDCIVSITSATKRSAGIRYKSVPGYIAKVLAAQNHYVAACLGFRVILGYIAKVQPDSEDNDKPMMSIIA